MNDSQSSDDLCTEAQRCVRSKDFERAEKLFRDVVQQDDAHIDAHEGLAAVLFLTGRPEEAVTEFERVTRLAPTRGAGFINLGATYNRLGEFGKAADALRKGIQKEKASSQGHYNLGIAQRGLNQLSMAVTAYKQAIRLEPEMAEAHQNLGNVYLDMGNHRQAIACFTKALEIRPDFERAKRGLRSAQQATDKVKRAITPFGRLVDQEVLGSRGADIEYPALSNHERFQDREFLRQNCRTKRERTRELADYIDNELEPALLSVNRVVIQADGMVGLYETHEQFRNVIEQLKALRGQTLSNTDELRSHEDEIRGVAE